LLVLDQGLSDDLDSQIGQRLLDHPALLHPLERHVKTRIFTIKVEQFVTARPEQLARAQHGHQLELEREAGLAIPWQVVLVETVPEGPDLILRQDACARMLGIKFGKVDAGTGGDVVAAGFRGPVEQARGRAPHVAGIGDGRLPTMLTCNHVVR